MGNNVLLAILGLVVFFSIITRTMNEREKGAAENTYGYVKYTHARDVSRSAINVALRFMADSGSGLIGGGGSLTGTLDGGSYAVNGTVAGDTVRLTSRATYNDTLYTIKTKLYRFPKPFPTVGAAVSLAVDSLGFDMRGTPAIDGRNYNSSGDSLTGQGNVPGVAVGAAYPDSVTVAAKGGYIQGTQDVVVDSAISDPSDYINLYMSAADIVLNQAGSPYGGTQTWGTQANPKIVFIDAGDSTRPVRVTGNITGWGILVVRGNFDVRGTFEWHGLVVGYSNTVFDFAFAAGTPKIIGSLLMGGPNHSEFEMRGSSKVLYSSSALQQAQYIGKLLAYRIIDWYE